MSRFVQPVTLSGSHATLAPLSMDHAEGLREAARASGTSMWRALQQLVATKAVSGRAASALGAGACQSQTTRNSRKLTGSGVRITTLRGLGYVLECGDERV